MLRHNFVVFTLKNSLRGRNTSTKIVFFSFVFIHIILLSRYTRSEIFVQKTHTHKHGYMFVCICQLDVYLNASFLFKVCMYLWFYSFV